MQYNESLTSCLFLHVCQHYLFPDLSIPGISGFFLPGSQSTNQPICNCSQVCLYLIPKTFLSIQNRMPRCPPFLMLFFSPIGKTSLVFQGHPWLRVQYSRSSFLVCNHRLPIHEPSSYILLLYQLTIKEPWMTMGMKRKSGTRVQWWRYMSLAHAVSWHPLTQFMPNLDESLLSLMNYCWCQSSIWYAGFKRTQLMTGTFGCTIIWCPMVSLSLMCSIEN